MASRKTSRKKTSRPVTAARAEDLAAALANERMAQPALRLPKTSPGKTRPRKAQRPWQPPFQES
jgi:hypothetical protein